MILERFFMSKNYLYFIMMCLFASHGVPAVGNRGVEFSAIGSGDQNNITVRTTGASNVPRNNTQNDGDAPCACCCVTFLGLGGIAATVMIILNGGNPAGGGDSLVPNYLRSNSNKPEVVGNGRPNQFAVVGNGHFNPFISPGVKQIFNWDDKKNN